MRKLLWFALLFSVTSVIAADKAAPTFDVKKILGHYQGEALNGGGLQPVDTTFKVGREGQLIGNYELHGPGREFKGQLSNAIFETSRRISTEWTDKDGEGQAVFEFSADFQSFTGQWSDSNGSGGPWNGKKVLGPVQ